jgi:RsiW-degrading membrane proteinase PrsW (M82 family)
MTADTAMVWLAAIAPALLWALILWLVARPASAGAAVAAALLGGIIVAWPASHVSQALFDAAASLAGDSSARRLVPGILVPVVEEVAKASVIALLLPWMPHRIAVGAAVGAAIGLGFTPVENLQHLTLAAIQGGEAGLWRAAYVRGVLVGLHHATFAATTGVGFAYARLAPAARKRWVPPRSDCSRRCYSTSRGTSTAHRC